MLTTENLSELVELFSWGFAIGVGGGGGAFVIALIVNTFYDIAKG
jgi:hypothetical protein